MSCTNADEVASPQSSLVLRFVNNDFQENKEPTIGGTLLAVSARLSIGDLLTTVDRLSGLLDTEMQLTDEDDKV